jgi:plastocyanin
MNIPVTTNKPGASLWNRRSLLRSFGLVGVGAISVLLGGCKYQALINSLIGNEKSNKPVTIFVGGPNAEFAFYPDRLQIELGDQLTWELQSGGHTVTAYHPTNFNLYQPRIPDGADPWDFDLLAAKKGTSFSWTPKSEGVYNYFCRPHESVGMVGVIVVGRAIPGPGLAAPQQEIPSLARQKLEELVAWAKRLS